jgi:hypothetical protein
MFAYQTASLPRYGSGEITMVEIFLVQFLTAALGAASTALADWFYRTARISQRTHSFWVSASIAVICLPVFIWICYVFLGYGLIGQAAAGILFGTVFFWVYRNLRQLPPLPNLGSPDLPSHPSSSSAIPPISKVNR